jgi:hypothetical protein
MEMRLKLFLTIFLINISVVNSQSKEESIVPNDFGEFYYVKNHSKSLRDFRFKLPNGFEVFRDGRDNSVVKVFKKMVSTGKVDFFGNPILSKTVEFTITTLKWKDFPKYSKILNMSDIEIQNVMIENLKMRDKNIDPNEFFKFYNVNNQFWTIVGTWSNEKNLYLIMCNHYSNKQSTQLSFHSTTIPRQKNIIYDIKNIKLLIDSFEFLD